MSKIHSKINSIKSIALTIIAIGIVIVVLQTSLVINKIISSQKSSEKTIDPLIVQQQKIQKAFNLIKSQTVDSE